MIIYLFEWSQTDTVKYIILPTLPLPFKDVGLLHNINYVHGHKGKSMIKLSMFW
jgi:hypothetical protein